MHCPRCGQQQVSEEIKFCSRCGLPLDLIAEIVARGGFLPQLADVSKKGKLPSRKMGVKIGFAWILIFLLIFTPLALVADAEEVAGAFALIGIIGGFLMMVFSWMFLEKETKPFYNQAMMQSENSAQQFLGGNRSQTALPPQQSQPVSSYAPPAAGSWKADTNDLVPRGVTEETTKLLEKDEKYL